VNKHRLKPKTPTANKHTKTSSKPASSKNQSPTPAGAKRSLHKSSDMRTKTPHYGGYVAGELSEHHARKKEAPKQYTIYNTQYTIHTITTVGPRKHPKPIISFAESVTV
jgi:hypothetical protein